MEISDSSDNYSEEINISKNKVSTFSSSLKEFPSKYSVFSSKHIAQDFWETSMKYCFGTAWFSSAAITAAVSWIRSIPVYIDYSYKQAILEVMNSSMTVGWQTNTVSLASWSSNSEIWKRILKNTQLTVAITNNDTDGAARSFTQS